MATKRIPTASASRRAIVVLPVPGGPQRTIEASLPAATIRPIAPSGPVRWSWPTTSSSACGRSRSASGALSGGGADGFGGGGSPANRSAMAALLERYRVELNHEVGVKLEDPSSRRRPGSMNTESGHLETTVFMDSGLRRNDGEG